jgi:hypothetical protein
MAKITREALKRLGFYVSAARDGITIAKTDADDLSYSDLQQLLQEELNEIERQDLDAYNAKNQCSSSIYVVDIYPEKCVYQIGYGQGLWERTYSVTGEGKVKFGERTAVTRKTTYVPDEADGDSLRALVNRTLTDFPVFIRTDAGLQPEVIHQDEVITLTPPGREPYRVALDSFPLAQRGVVMVHPTMLDVHPEIQHKKVKDADNNTTGKEEAQPETYDVDKGGTLLAWRSGYRAYVVDGHHRRKLAINAKSVVSSKLGGKGEPVPVDRHIPVRVLDEDDGWTLEHVKALGQAVNASKAAKDASLGTDAEERSEYADEEFELSTDAVKDGILKVRQKAARADSVNRNRRLHPMDVMNDAIKRANKRANAGAMLSEMLHPEVVRTSQGEQFVDNPESKTARIDHIEPVDPKSKWVWIRRTILDTDEGRTLASAYKSAAAKRAKGDAKAQPPGLSMRYKQLSDSVVIDSVSVDKARALDIITFDDVPNPAVDGAGEFQLLTDSQLHEIEGGSPESKFNTSNPEGTTSETPADKTAGAGDSRVQPAGAPEVTTVKKSDIQRAIEAFYDAVAAKKDAKEVMEARTTAQDAVLKGLGAKVDGMPALCNDYLKAEADMEIGGYKASASAPIAILGNATGFSTAGGYAPDTTRGATQNRRPHRKWQTTRVCFEAMQRARSCAKSIRSWRSCSMSEIWQRLKRTEPRRWTRFLNPRPMHSPRFRRSHAKS